MNSPTPDATLCRYCGVRPWFDMTSFQCAECTLLFGQVEGQENTMSDEHPQFDQFKAERLQDPVIRAAYFEARCAEYENSITWNTSCLSCSKTLDSSYAEHVRAEKAEQRCAELEVALKDKTAEFIRMENAWRRECDSLRGDNPKRTALVHKDQYDSLLAERDRLRDGTQEILDTWWGSNPRIRLVALLNPPTTGETT